MYSAVSRTGMCHEVYQSKPNEARNTFPQENKQSEVGSLGVDDKLRKPGFLDLLA